MEGPPSICDRRDPTHMSRSNWHRGFSVTVAVAALTAFVATPTAQDRLRTMPGYDQFQEDAGRLAQGAVVSGAATNVQWAADGAAVTYNAGGKALRTRSQDDDGGPSNTATAGAVAGGWNVARLALDAQDVQAARSEQGQGAGRSGGMEQAQSELTAIRRRLPDGRRGARAVRPTVSPRRTASSRRSISRAQPLGRELRRHRRKAGHEGRQRDDADQVRHGQLGLRRGTGSRRRRSGGRPTARRSASTGSTRAR